VHISKISLFRIDLPLSTPFHHASSGLVSNLEEVVARVETSTGVEGWGEVRGNCTYVTGDTPNRIMAAASFLAQKLPGEPLDELPRLSDLMGKLIVGNSAAKALLDIALHDALAKAFGVPLAVILGGVRRRRLPSDICIPFCPAGEAATVTRTAISEGYTVIKVRMGLSPEEDSSRCAAVREVIAASGSAAVIAIDANGAWTPKQALARIHLLEPFEPVFIEQPVAAEDIPGLRFLRERSPIPIMADESVQTPRTLLELIERQAADMFHFKLIKAGGFIPLKRMMGMAEVAGMPYMIGQMDEGMLATAAAVHAGAASSAAYFEVHCDRGVASQPFSGLTFEEGYRILPEGPGLGVRVDEKGLVHVASFPQ